MKKQKIIDCSVYKDQTEKQIVDRVNKTQRLLLHFGLSAFAYDPGVKCLVLGDKSFQVRYVDFDASTWEWLEPLLRELLMYRRKYETVRKGL